MKKVIVNTEKVIYAAFDNLLDVFQRYEVEPLPDRRGFVFLGSDEKTIEDFKKDCENYGAVVIIEEL